MKQLPTRHLIDTTSKITSPKEKCKFLDCDKNPINSHTIPTNMLNKMCPNPSDISIFKHEITKSEDVIIIEKKPINKTKFSAFSGFCSDHDSNLFKMIDEFDGNMTQEKAALIHYRTICYGIHDIYEAIAKATHLKNQKYYANDEVSIECAKLHTYLKSDTPLNRLNYCLEEHLKRKQTLENMILEADFEAIRYEVFPNGAPNIVFFGRSNYLLHPNKPFFKIKGYSYMPWVSYITLIHHNKSDLIFCWLEDDSQYLKYYNKQMVLTNYKPFIEKLAFCTSDSFAIENTLYETHRENITAMIKCRHI